MSTSANYDPARATASPRSTPIDVTVRAVPPKTAVIGAGGFLGRQLLAAYRTDYPDTLGTLREPSGGEPRLDLAAVDIAPLRLAEAGYEAAIITAGLTNVAACQRDAQFAVSRNVTGTLRLAGQLAELGIKTVFLSSDYVFDGIDGGYDDDAVLRPLNVYGACKAQVERRLPDVCGENYLIVRLSKVFGLAAGDGTLLDEMAAQLLQGKVVRAAADQVFCPTYVNDVVRAILSLQAAGGRGTYNVCAPEAWCRADLATKVAAAIGAPPKLVETISLSDLGEGFARPRRTDMKCRKLAAACPPHAPIEFRSIRACIELVAAHYTRRSKSDGKNGTRAERAA